MKIKLALLAALCPLVASSPFAPTLHAQLTAADPSYQATPFFTHTNADNIVSYDWAANGNIYYQTSTADFTFGGFYGRNGSGAITQIVAGGSSSTFPGASVVSVGQNVYFNTSDFTNQNIYKYGPVNGTPGVTLASTTTNYALAANQGRLFITGAPNFGTNHIYYSALDASGNLTSNPAVDLGADSGSSGPLGFDAAGNLFYAPGFGDQSVYRWSAAEVNAAIGDPAANPLTATGHLWLDYSGLYSSVSGGTSLLLDPNGNLLLTLTNFNGPSVLAKFGIGPNGAYDGSAKTLFQDTDIIGELRLHDGGLFLSSGNQVFSIVPEPGTLWWIVVMGTTLVICIRRQPARARAQVSQA